MLPCGGSSFKGGDLRGIVDKLDYLCELGVNALYLNPVFAAATTHRYNTYDCYQVAPLLGGNEALRELLDEAHAPGIRVILDGVFSHCGRGFWPFHHVLENGKDSPYLDWFHIEGWPLRPYTYGDDHGLANYAHWSRHPALPKLNTDNPAVREFIFGVARHWLELGIDGWRLDVPEDIDDDSFWQEFRQVVKSANPDAYILGEIWHEAQRWLQGDQFDAVMNYPFASAAMGFFGARTLTSEYNPDHFPQKALDAEEFAQRVDRLHGLYDWEINHAQLNLLDSHDTPRALWMMGGDKSALRLAVVFQTTIPGAPCVYYGDEIGLSSHQRQTLPWQDEATWDKELLGFYRRAIPLRSPGGSRVHRLRSVPWGRGHLWAPGALRVSAHGGWRREQDSNPRETCASNGFQNRRLRPLGHPAGDQGQTSLRTSSATKMGASSRTESAMASLGLESTSMASPSRWMMSFA